MREFRTYGSVRGALGNGRSYRDQTMTVSEGSRRTGRGSHPKLGPRPALRRDGDHEMTQEQKIIRAKVGLLELASLRSLLTIAACRGLRPHLTADLKGPALISCTAPHLLLQKCVRDTPSRCHLSPRWGARRQHLLNHAQAQREPKIQPYRIADDLSRVSIAGVNWVSSCRHPAHLPDQLSSHQAGSRST